MPTVRVSLSEFQNGLPLVCVVCGAPCTSLVPHTFAWHPPTVTGFAALAMTRRARGLLPLCRRHGYYFLWRLLAPIAGIVGAVGFLFAGLVLAERFRFYHPPGVDWGGVVGVVFCVMLVALGVFVGYLQWFGVHPECIDDKAVHIAGAHALFARAVRESRQSEPEAGDHQPKASDNPFENWE